MGLRLNELSPGVGAKKLPNVVVVVSVQVLAKLVVAV